MLAFTALDPTQEEKQMSIKALQEEEAMLKERLRDIDQRKRRTSDASSASSVAISPQRCAIGSLSPQRTGAGRCAFPVRPPAVPEAPSPPPTWGALPAGPPSPFSSLGRLLN